MGSVSSIGIISDNFLEVVEKLLAGETFTHCLQFLEAQAKQKHPTASIGAINNCRGRWFEVMLTYLANYQTKKSDILFLKLGTAREHSIFDIFKGTKERLNKLLSNGSSLNLSIPDLIVIDIADYPRLQKWKSGLLNLSAQSDGSEISLKILSGYKAISAEPLTFKDCKALCSIKTSLRPDRKYQAMYEAEFIKAFQKRFFPTSNPPQYIMVGPLEAKATQSILENNLSLVSIALNDESHIKPTIDKVCVVNTLDEMSAFIKHCQEL